ncbi:hypothetical protein [Oleiphilus sp. HI0086]|uniref:hypothetical protein n=1 Tax=Oleiphilus sp. HI0086 TaxID=1822260 RepID=UPI0034CEBD84
MPMYFGSLVAGCVLGVTGYFGIDAIWKRATLRKWHHRVAARKARKDNKSV